jgi:hypothetical protein
MNLTIPRWLHISLYIVCVLLTAVLYQASKGNITLTGSAGALLSMLLAIINSVDPQTVLAKAPLEHVEVAAKRLPPATLARLADDAKIKAA